MKIIKILTATILLISSIGCGSTRVVFVDTQADMADALIASCFLPHRAQQTHTFRGLPCVDGGFSNNQPIFGSNCLRVSPFWFHAASHIKPNMRVRPDYACWVPTARKAWWLFDRGAADFERFAKREMKFRTNAQKRLQEDFCVKPWMNLSSPLGLKNVFKLIRH